MITLEFLVTSLIVVLIPGTGVLFTVATALARGRRAGLYAARGACRAFHAGAPGPILAQG